MNIGLAERKMKWKEDEKLYENPTVASRPTSNNGIVNIFLVKVLFGQEFPYEYEKTSILTYNGDQIIFCNWQKFIHSDRSVCYSFHCSVQWFIPCLGTSIFLYFIPMVFHIAAFCHGPPRTISRRPTDLSHPDIGIR